jgi:hypothetical protein
MKSRPSCPGPGFRPGLFAVGFSQIEIEALEEDMQPFRHILGKTCLLAATLLMLGAASPFTALAAPIAGRLDRKLSFTVTIPQTDDYYIVLDNRRGSADQEVSLLVRGVGPSRGMTPKGSSPL